MGLKILLLGIIFAVIIYEGSEFLNVTGLLRDPVANKAKNGCQYIKGFSGGGAEDITKISENFAVTGGDKRHELWEKKNGPENVPNGGIFLIDLETDKVFQFKIRDFPQNRKFHPHGIYYNHESKILSVINHGYDGIPSRIEQFKLDVSNVKEPVANHIRSLVVETEHNGVINDNIQISEDEYIVTQYLSQPDPLKGRQNHTLLQKLKGSLRILFNLKSTFVLHCSFKSQQKIEKEVQMQCQRIEDTYGTMMNGITWDRNKEVVVADTVDRKLYVYQLQQEKAKNQILKLKKVIPSTYLIDNIEFDKFYNQYIGGGIGRAIEHFQYSANSEAYPADKPYWASVDVVKKDENGEIGQLKNILVEQRAILGCSSALLYKNKLYLGSWTDTQIAMCQL